MLELLRNTWALLLGMLLLMVGNGLQGSLLGVRGTEAGFSTLTLSVVMAAYFAGFLTGSRLAPEMIRRVGHVRVFAALGSLVSAVLILFPAVPDPLAWIAGRVVLGFCFSGVYVTAESWLNHAATNDTRGQALSAYMTVQMVGIIAAQAILVVPDASGFLLFVIPSVLVSVSFAPILLSVSPTPAFGSTKPMTLKALFQVSPLGMVGMFLMGGVFAAQFGMAAVYGAEAGMTLGQISGFVAAFYVGALVMQFPLGWLSDRMDRRMLIMLVAAIGGAASLLAGLSGGGYLSVVLAALVIGGCANPLYSLLIAHTTDYLEPDDMAAASSGLLFVNGLGAIAGPLIIGYMMQIAGPAGFFHLLTVLLLAITGYGLYRRTRRSAPSVEDTASYAPVMPSATPVALEAAQEFAIENAEEPGDDDALNGATAFRSAQ